MTREEAIEIIESRNFYCIECIDRTDECCKALEMAIESLSAEKNAEKTNLTSEELFALDIEQNVKDIDSGEDDSYYRGRLAGMLSAYRILKGKPYEEKESKELPSAEKTAEWLIVGKTTMHYECSKCGGAGDKWDKFCKHCGADMRRESEDNE